MNSLPLGLKNAIESGNCVLFLGAGIGRHLKDAEGYAAPDAAQLAVELANQFDIATSSVDLSKVSQAIVDRQGSRADVENYIKSRLANLEPDETLKWLFNLRWRAIFTTNYDFGIERCYELLPSPKQNPISIAFSSQVVAYDPRFQVPIYHLHGTLFGSDKPQIVITRDDYLRFRERRRGIFELLKNSFATSTILYIGYSHQDPNWNLVLDEMSEDFYPASLLPSYRFAPSTELLDLEYLRTRGIETIESTYEQFQAVAALNLEISDLGVGILEQVRTTVPKDLLPEFERNPAPVTRLISSWTYVNQANFSETSNVNAFLKGNHPNWSLIAADHTFERDIEEDLYSQVLDYATVSEKHPYVVTLLGPAGYGITTVLMRLAVRLVKDKAGPVFMLKPGQTVIPGIVEFAASVLSDVVFFVVDNAADASQELMSIIDRLTHLGKRIVLILGERANEWRQKRVKPTSKEFLIEALSDQEIYRLLDYLQSVSALGRLGDLKRDMQFDIIKNKHAKQLLVVMREATEGKSFDAILEDEYRGIDNELSKKLYLIVCCFHQFGIYVRSELLASILNLSLVEMYQQTEASTEGVVIYDVIDMAREEYGARARHRIIAEVVWHRVGVDSDRESIIQATISLLNPFHRIDRVAFDQFVKDDSFVESISTFEGKTKFFETAIRKDPDSPYVRQHFARMLLRSDRQALALDQIESAISLNPKVRVLYHTKGVILSRISTTSESIELGRKYLVQSEHAFRQALNIYAGDEYSFHGLAELYFEWAKRAPTENETVEYLGKAEDTITDSLRKVRNRESLWILSSKIHDWLGDEPARLQALERAVQENPSSVIARYLLGREYRKNGQPEKAIEVLDPVVRTNFSEFRSFVEYALALILSGHSYREAIAYLNQSTLYGYDDPRFLATLGGMLYLNSEFSEAEKTFLESTRRNFPYAEANKVLFQPPDLGNADSPLRFSGVIAEVKAQYSYIDTAMNGRFVCLSSKYDGLLMEPGLKVNFEPAFTARGAIAIRPRKEVD